MATKQYERPREGAAIAREVGGKVAPAGVWRHKDSGQEAIVQEDPLFGNAQAQAFLQTGFEYVRPAEPGEVKTLPELQAEARTDAESATKGLAARLDRLEDSNAKNAAALEETQGKLQDTADENARLAEENAKLREQLDAAQKVDAKDAKTAAKTAKADAKTAKETQAHVEDANTDHDAAVESGDAAKADAERVTDAREDEKAPEADATVPSPEPKKTASK